MIRSFLFLLTLFILLPLTLRAQTDSVVQAPRSVNEGTMVSLGSRYVKNTYLSDVGYDGVGIGVINERMRITNDHWSRQRTFRIDLASIRNPAGTSSGYAAFIDYSCIDVWRPVWTVCDCSSAVRGAISWARPIARRAAITLRCCTWKAIWDSLRLSSTVSTWVAGAIR